MLFDQSSEKLLATPEIGKAQKTQRVFQINQTSPRSQIQDTECPGNREALCPRG